MTNFVTKSHVYTFLHENSRNTLGRREIRKISRFYYATSGDGPVIREQQLATSLA
jgi:hypothetical protein